YNWDKIGFLLSNFVVPYQVPGATVLKINTAVGYQDDLAAYTTKVSSGTFTPQITPPLNPLIQGANAFAEQTGVTLTPTISWSAPTTGTPTFYSVLIRGI